MRPAVSAEPDDADEPEEIGPGRPAAARAGGVVAELTGADVTTPLTVEQVPAPYAGSPAEELDDRERADLTTCERAVASLQVAFAVAGKALATINQARLYRETHSTFAEYVEDRWGMRRSQAYRLIEAWPVAVALSPIGDINEAQVRELVPVAKRHGVGAARTVYEAVREQGGRVTAARLREAVRALPSRLASPDQAGDVVRVAVAEGRLTAPAPARPSVDEHQEPEQDAGDVTPEQVDAGAEAMATLEAAVAQQRQVYEAIPPEVLEAAMLYDLGRAERLRHEGAQYATRAGFRFRGGDEGGGA
nr:hypothetical protein [Streptomyces taklimakanensis]